MNKGPTIISYCLSILSHCFIPCTVVKHVSWEGKQENERLSWRCWCQCITSTNLLRMLVKFPYIVFNIGPLTLRPPSTGQWVFSVAMQCLFSPISILHVCMSSKELILTLKSFQLLFESCHNAVLFHTTNLKSIFQYCITIYTSSLFNSTMQSCKGIPPYPGVHLSCEQVSTSAMIKFNTACIISPRFILSLTDSPFLFISQS